MLDHQARRDGQSHAVDFASKHAGAAATRRPAPHLLEPLTEPRMKLILARKVKEWLDANYPTDGDGVWSVVYILQIIDGEVDAMRSHNANKVYEALSLKIQAVTNIPT